MKTNIVKKLECFFSKFKLEEYKNGQILIQASEEPSGIFFLKKGIVKQYITSKDGLETTLNIYKPFSFFPMTWALNDSANRYSFETASKKVTVYRAPKKEVINFLKSEPEVLYDLAKRAFSGIEGLLSRMEYLMSGNAAARLIIVLIILARRFGQEQDGKTQIKLILTEKEIASQAGLARETVSREIQKLKAKNLISYNSKILTILNIDKLEEEISLH